MTYFQSPTAAYVNYKDFEVTRNKGGTKKKAVLD